VHVSTIGFRAFKTCHDQKVNRISNRIKMQEGLHPHFPFNFPQFIMIWIEDPTLWHTCHEHTLNKKILEARKKGFKTFTISFHMFFWKRSSKSNRSKAFVPSKSCTILAILTYNLIIRVLVVAKSLQMSEWLWDWFTTQTVTTRLEHDVATFSIAHIWAF
jgi:hypothetical protein